MAACLSSSARRSLSVSLSDCSVQTGVDDSDKILNEYGILAFEIGHDQGKEVSDLMIEKGYKNVRIVKDLAGHDRVVIGEL